MKMNKSEQLKECIEKGIGRLGEEDVRFLNQIAVIVKRYLEDKEEKCYGLWGTDREDVEKIDGTAIAENLVNSGRYGKWTVKGEEQDEVLLAIEMIQQGDYWKDDGNAS